MSLALEEFTDWVQRSLEDEVEAVMRQAQGVPESEMRPMALHFSNYNMDNDISDFRANWPDCSERAFRLAYGMLKTSLLTAAMFPSFASQRADMGRSLLLTLGVSLDPWSFGGALVSPNERRPLKVVMDSLGGRSAVAERVEAILEDRVRALNYLPSKVHRQMKYVYRYLVFTTALEVSMVIYNDGVMYPEEFAEIETLNVRRGWAVSRFMALYNWLDEVNVAEYSQTMGLLQEALGIVAQEEEEELLGIDPTARDIIMLFPTVQERLAILACLVVVLYSKGSLNDDDRELCHLLGHAIDIPANLVEDLLKEGTDADAL